MQILLNQKQIFHLERPSPYLVFEPLAYLSQNIVGVKKHQWRGGGVQIRRRRGVMGLEKPCFKRIYLGQKFVVQVVFLSILSLEILQKLLVEFAFNFFREDGDKQGFFDGAATPRRMQTPVDKGRDFFKEGRPTGVSRRPGGVHRAAQVPQ